MSINGQYFWKDKRKYIVFTNREINKIIAESMHKRLYKVDNVCMYIEIGKKCINFTFMLN